LTLRPATDHNTGTGRNRLNYVAAPARWPPAPDNDRTTRAAPEPALATALEEDHASRARGRRPA